MGTGIGNKITGLFWALDDCFVALAIWGATRLVCYPVNGQKQSMATNITDNKFVLSYRLSNDDLVILDLKEEFARSKRQTMNFEKLFN